MKKTFIPFALLAFILLLQACSKPTTVPIAYAKDNCDQCMMTISDQKYGSELVTNTGKAYKFDSPECLAAFYNEEAKVKKADVHSLWVTDFVHPGELIDATTAIYWESDMLRSPMGMNYSAFKTQEALDAAKTSYPGTQKTWNDALSYVSTEWGTPTASATSATDSTHALCAHDSCACNHRFGEPCKCKHEMMGKNNNCPCKHNEQGACACKHDK